MSHRFRSRRRRIRRPRTALVVDPRSGGLVTRPIRPWTRLAAHLCADRLDRQLAGGVLPESSGLLAVRAQRLVSPARCAALATSWAQLMYQAHCPPTRRGNRLPLCHERITAAEDDIRVMLAQLSGATPSAARGVAMLTVLLHSGDGPLFNRACLDDLRHQLHRAVEELDPIMSLQSWA